LDPAGQRERETAPVGERNGRFKGRYFFIFKEEGKKKFKKKKKPRGLFLGLDLF
jgi:hypothetical protein